MSRLLCHNITYDILWQPYLFTTTSHYRRHSGIVQHNMSDSIGSCSVEYKYKLLCQYISAGWYYDSPGYPLNHNFVQCFQMWQSIYKAAISYMEPASISNRKHVVRFYWQKHKYMYHRGTQVLIEKCFVASQSPKQFNYGIYNVCTFTATWVIKLSSPNN